MQNSAGFDFSKILDQTLYTYIPDKFKKLEDTSTNMDSGVPEHGLNVKLGLVGRLRPVVELIAISEIIVGLIMLTFLVALACEYDKMYATENSGFSAVLLSYLVLFVGSGTIVVYRSVVSAYPHGKRLISMMSFGGLVLLIVNGMMLLTSLKMEKRKILGSYLLLSTILWIYMFVLSIMKIHYALMVIEAEANKVVQPEKRHFLLSNACIMGVVTMLGTVVHFIGNVTVFTYYNLKYVQPILLNCGP